MREEGREESVGLAGWEVSRLVIHLMDHSTNDHSSLGRICPKPEASSRSPVGLLGPKHLDHFLLLCQVCYQGTGSKAVSI